MVAEGSAAVTHDAAGRRGGATRGFLFSDLRGYTAFVDRRGAEAAAALLERYRALVRAAIAGHDGAEMGTEGDSFYVAFPSVSSALRCGLEIVAAADPASPASPDPIRVGVGVHAGETVETAEGYVGQAINIAARLCAIASPGEVLVSDTVRSLTDSVVDVRFTPRGRRRLKGVAEPVAVFSAVPLDRTHSGSRALTTRRYGRPLIVAAGALGILAVVAAAVVMRPMPTQQREWTIGLSVPLTGEVAPFAEPIRRAAELAISETMRAGGVPGASEIVLDVLDSGGGEFGEDPAKAAANAADFIADPSVVAMIGPFQSDVAEDQIPMTNEAGLLQCGASTTDPRLTKPEAGALLLRSANPDRINFIRLPAAADVEARAVASFAFHDLGSRSALVIDDTLLVGGVVADGFQREFEALGGTVVRRALNPGANAMDVLAPLTMAANAPTLVFFGGFTFTGAPQVRQAMVESGHDDVPFVGWDGLWDGSGQEDESFIALAGSGAVGSYVSHPSVGTISNQFDRAYRAAFGALPNGQVYEFAAASYACVEIVLESLAAVLPAGGIPATVREAVRAHAVDSANRFQTVIGNVSFDDNGDSVHQLVTFYRVDPNAAGGAGDWVPIKNQDFGTDT